MTLFHSLKTFQTQEKALLAEIDTLTKEKITLLEQLKAFNQLSEEHKTALNTILEQATIINDLKKHCLEFDEKVSTKALEIVASQGCAPVAIEPEHQGSNPMPKDRQSQIRYLRELAKQHQIQ